MIVGSFYVAWIPVNVYNVIMSTVFVEYLEELAYLDIYFLVIVVTFSSTINPFVYTLYKPEMRKELRLLLPCIV